MSQSEAEACLEIFRFQNLNPNSSENIPRCARQMLCATDRGCYDFMGVKIGLGVFVAESGRNRIAIHQANNAHSLDIV